MQAKAYVLIEAEAGHVGAVIASLKKLPGVTEADAVTGPYDIILVVEADDNRTVGRLMMNNVHNVQGVKRTVTCLTIG